MVYPDPRIPCYSSGWLYCSALQFLPPALEVLAEIKTTTFYNEFCLRIFRLELLHNAFKISFSTTWLNWQLHCIIFQIRKRNSELTDNQICCFLFIFSF